MSPQTSDRPLSSNFIANYFGGESLKEGEADSELKGRHIIRVGWDDVASFLGEVCFPLAEITLQMLDPLG